MAWRGVMPALVATIVAMLPSFLTAALIVQIGDDTGLTVTGLGVVISLFFGMAALVSPSAGRLSERVGWGNGLRISTLLSAVALAAIALLGSSVAVIGISLAIAGIGSSLTQTASNLTIARCVAPRRHGWVLGIKHACVPAAMFLAGLAVPTLALTVGWRWAFAAAAVLALATTASVPRREAPYTLTPPPKTTGKTVGKPTTPMRLLVVLAVAVGLGIGALDPLGSFFVSYSVSIGIEEQVAGVLLSIGGLCGIIARLVAGRLIDRMVQADFTVIASMMVAGAVGLFIVNLGELRRPPHRGTHRVHRRLGLVGDLHLRGGEGQPGSSRRGVGCRTNREVPRGRHRAAAVRRGRRQRFVRRSVLDVDRRAAHRSRSDPLREEPAIYGADGARSLSSAAVIRTAPSASAALMMTHAAVNDVSATKPNNAGPTAAPT